jgi:glycosyltransferase involved in cell wall biosynthesis
MPLKVLILTHEYPPVGGGAGNASHFFSKELVQLGVKVNVVTSSFNHLLPNESTDGISIFRIPCSRKKIVNSNPLEQTSFFWASWRWILKQLDQLQPDCIIAFHTFPAGLTALLLKKQKKIPYIAMLRGHDVPGWSPQEMKFYHFIAKPMIHAVWKNASHIVANSLGLQKLAMKNSAHKRIQVIENGVDAGLYKPDPSVKKSVDEVVVLACGRLKIQKRFDLLLDAARICIQKESSIKIIIKIAGEGPEYSKLRNLCRKYGIDNRVTFLNWLDRSKLLEEYQAADIFVSTSDYEGMPNVILEAMSSGLPVVATQTQGSEELVENNVNGFLIPTNGVENLSHALLTLIRNSDLRKRMGAQGRSMALNSRSWKSLAKKLLDLIIQSQNTRSQ